MVVVGAADDARVKRLREQGIIAVSAQDRAAALAWARGWGFSHVIDGATLVEVETGAESSATLALT